MSSWSAAAQDPDDAGRPGAFEPFRRRRSGWTLEALVEDLEQQAAGHRARARAEDVEALRVASFAELDLASRLHGAGLEPGADLEIQVLGGRRFRGAWLRTGADFVVLDTGGVQWVVMSTAIASIGGVGRRSVVAEARSLPSRLGLRSVLQGIVDRDLECALLLRDASLKQGRPLRVGRDFAEFTDPESRGAVFLVPFSSLAAVRL